MCLSVHKCVSSRSLDVVGWGEGGGEAVLWTERAVLKWDNRDLMPAVDVLRYA